MTEPTNHDAAIRRALTADDEQALELLWDGYGTLLFGLIASVVRSRHDAEEIMQELFVKIARQRQRLAAAENLRAYLCVMARHEALSWWRRPQRREQPAAPADFWLVPAPTEAGPQADEDAAALRHALGQLPEDQRTVVVLKHYHDFTFQEIGATMGVTLNTAASRYRYAIEKLRVILRELR
jgi:RNA polymerase sigma-70 factor (ECF subfamily)